MRNFKNFDDNKQHFYSDRFPDLEKLLNSEETDAYCYIAISVFDHWLNNEDATKLLSTVPEEEQKQRDLKFERFARKLIGNTEIINFTFKGRWPKSRLVFRSFTSEKAKENYMLSSPKNGNSDNFFRVVLAEFEALYFESWDDTNALYFRNERHADVIESWANECGLYRL